MSKKTWRSKNFFENINNDDKTSIFFESSKRIEKTLTNFSKLFNVSKSISLCKEMTKIHENIFRGKIEHILQSIKSDEINLKGEIVVVLEGSKNKKINSRINSNVKKEFLSKLSVTDSAKLIASITGENKRDIYKRLIEK